MLATHSFVADTLTPVRAYAAIRHAAGDAASFLFESVVGGERWGRFSILGYRPKEEWALYAEGGADDPLTRAEHLFAEEEPRKGGPAERLVHARVGYVAWDMVHAIAKVPGWGERSPMAPLARFMRGCTIILFDALSQTVTIAAEDKRDVDRARRDLEHLPTTMTALPMPDRSRWPAGVEVDVDDAAYEAKVRRAKEYIAAGDAFQIVLARTFVARREGRDPFDLYRAMRVLNPSPYMYFLDLPPADGETERTQIAGASPETMVRLHKGTMTVRPIAGTRPRGKTDEEDAAFERELLADPKERAEHVMLIDLGRNDVGRVAEIGSVELVRRMEIERYSHVMHIVSEVRGRVRDGTPPLEVVRAAFPAGTLSGAPKVRAMQIIRELEARPRGIYGGAVGYVAATGDLDFAIAIRTAVCRGDTIEVTAGAGIVEASDPKSEADETRAKARGVLCALDTVAKGTFP